MSVRVAVFDPLPMFCRGVAATLSDAGFEPETPRELLEWVHEAKRHVVLLTLCSPADWTLLADLHGARPDVVVVAVLDEATVAGYVRALTTGAAGAVPRDAAPGVLLEAFEAAVSGRCLIPIEVLHALTSPQERPEADPDLPSEREIDWLRQLARGITIVRLANRTGYSERMMFRLLRGLYDKLRVANRTEAIIHARDRGWL
jgi:DNA-binding NarL/FixJ family response regulator